MHGCNSNPVAGRTRARCTNAPVAGVLGEVMAGLTRPENPVSDNTSNGGVMMSSPSVRVLQELHISEFCIFSRFLKFLLKVSVMVGLLLAAQRLTSKKPALPSRAVNYSLRSGPRGNVTENPKIILLYVKTKYQPVIKELSTLRGCPEVKCRLTTNQLYLPNSSAVMFAANFLRLETPPPRHKDQVWILHNHESPQKHWLGKRSIWLPSWKNVFNWTFDYRVDSDIPAPYGVLQARNDTIDKDYSAIFKQKNGTIAWMVSNCAGDSKRMEYVKELMKYVQVDIYGACGNHKCPKKDGPACFEMLSSKYKFYLSFENAFCKDYVTEKFFVYYELNFILITRGGGDYTKQAENNTYINAMDFESAKHLADFVKQLANNETEYTGYLKRKDKYKSVYEEYAFKEHGVIVQRAYRLEAQGMCEVCRRLWDIEKYRKQYDDITTWFNKGLSYPQP
ncbi:glycoprotein 3-alpha-L-fucosyltransferase A-like [Haliotis rubra]|uniref:glycoprotein 3-alpha-L-fucosyltransferase A-like n=1 Tax=Haliotis rubra TaxID=36100 RepID=UPI001EE55A5D|nr:glycoprotein 3-alpha-L-fucosyltransferase A-like [Haliotis rubra]